MSMTGGVIILTQMMEAIARISHPIRQILERGTPNGRESIPRIHHQMGHRITIVMIPTAHETVVRAGIVVAKGQDMGPETRETIARAPLTAKGQRQVLMTHDMIVRVRREATPRAMS